MTATFPNNIYTERETENLPGIVFDNLKKQNLYSEDFQNHASEIIAIETFLKGQAHLFSVPTSPSGLASGDVWVDTTGGLNILKIVI
jgi:hypothetical protein